MQSITFDIYSLVISEEKVETRAEVKSFDKSNLKHVEPVEKTAAPTAEGKNTPESTETTSSRPATTTQPKKPCNIL